MGVAGFGRFPRRAAVYFAGYDANKHRAHNTAWIVRAPDAIALKTKGP